MPWTAAVKRACVIDRAEIPIDERDIERLVAVLFSRCPAVHVGLGAPDSVRPEWPRRRALAKAHQALPHGGIIWKRAGGGDGVIILGLDVKRRAHSSRLAGNSRAVEACAVIDTC